MMRISPSTRTTGGGHIFHALKEVIGRDNDQVAYMNEISRRAVYAYDAASPLSLDGVGGEPTAARDAPNVHLFDSAMSAASISSRSMDRLPS